MGRGIALHPLLHVSPAFPCAILKAYLLSWLNGKGNLNSSKGSPSIIHQIGREKRWRKSQWSQSSINSKKTFHIFEHRNIFHFCHWIYLQVIIFYWYFTPYYPSFIRPITAFCLSLSRLIHCTQVTITHLIWLIDRRKLWIIFQKISFLSLLIPIQHNNELHHQIYGKFEKIHLNASRTNHYLIIYIKCICMYERVLTIFSMQGILNSRK